MKLSVVPSNPSRCANVVKRKSSLSLTERAVDKKAAQPGIKPLKSLSTSTHLTVNLRSAPVDLTTVHMSSGRQNPNSSGSREPDQTSLTSNLVNRMKQTAEYARRQASDPWNSGRTQDERPSSYRGPGPDLGSIQKTTTTSEEYSDHSNSALDNLRTKTSIVQAGANPATTSESYRANRRV